MSFPAYDEHKESQLDWLGKVPTDWDVIPLKRRFAIVGGSTPKSGDDLLWDGEVRWATPSDLSKLDSLFLRDTQRTITEAGLESCGTTLVPAGTIILSTRAPIGSLAIAATDLCTNQGCKSLVPSSGVESKYFAYLLSVSTEELNIRGKGTTFLELSGDELGAFQVPFPLEDEQKAIASFLDAETSKIDALVADQRRLIELLKEKRQAVISHAVTKGLNPDVPMKPSGIEWLGDVPEHWRHGVKLKSLAINAPASFTNGPFGSDLLTSELQDEGVPVIYIRDLKVEGYKRKSSSHVTPEKAEQLDKFRVDAEDVLIAKVGDPPGFCCTYPIGEPAAIICQDVIRLKPVFSLISPYFLCFLLNSEPGKESIDSVCVELTRKRFSLADLQSLRFSIPPLDEQDEIVAELDRKLAKLDSLLAEAERAIELLQERRTALISAAVTGKIDVREFGNQVGSTEEMSK